MSQSQTTTPRHLPRYCSHPALALTLVLLAGCASMPGPRQVFVPAPVSGNSGKFLSPYTTDGTIAPWVRNARVAAAGAAIGGFAGRAAGQQAMESVPFIGGFLGKKAGNAAGRSLALKLVGGEEAMRRGSDISFKSADELAVFLYAFTPADSSERAQKQKVISLTQDIYPDVRDRWTKAIKKARLSKGQAQTIPSGLPTGFP